LTKTLLQPKQSGIRQEVTVEKKALTSLLMLWLAVSTLTAMQFTSLIKADPIIPEIVPMEHAYIRSNSNIDPPTLPIELSGNVYVFEDKISNYTIEIQKDNVMIDGNGFSLILSPLNEVWWEPKTGSPFIQISNRNNTIIKNIRFINNFRITDFFTSIRVENSSNVIILQNTMNSGGLGLSMTSGTNCSIIGNEFTGNPNTVGFQIADSIFLNIKYNNISSHFHEAEIDNLKFSNISRNNITGNGGAGFLLTGNNFENQIFENNFVDNVFGLFYQGDPRANFPSSTKNRVYNNYWHNNYQDIENISGDTISGRDQSPLTSPISAVFDPSLFTLPSLTPAPSPEPKSTLEPFTTALVVGASIASVAIISVGLLAYFKKRRR
jgi:parallel beta-helix repeat protein